ncbi:hypothetical protein [Carboxylicivirga marina]|uniref:Uncharacterized protein n=1 Tax=Carboxylicivirga marina TaxID=2800988 RepID=A0ABS1HGA2_9BACT|nr:hypothetical protein [Carboxylicivirga marina]MBK3516696.1 hypothetical protein [Carboxylicivirga marina]
MIDEALKSIRAILYERTVSPLFGTFFFSWSLWNWKIYFVIFLTETKELNGLTKFDYIDTHLLNWCCGLFWPAVSSLIILTGYAWLSEQAYKLWLTFDVRKNKIKNEKEEKKLLTKEQSINLRLEIDTLEQKYNDMLEKKNDIINALRKENSLLKKESDNENNQNNTTSLQSNEDYQLPLSKLNEFRKLIELKPIKIFADRAHRYISESSFLINDIPSFEKLIAYDLVIKSGSYFKLSSKGQEFLKWVVRSKN